VVNTDNGSMPLGISSSRPFGDRYDRSSRRQRKPCECGFTIAIKKSGRASLVMGAILMRRHMMEHKKCAVAVKPCTPWAIATAIQASGFSRFIGAKPRVVSIADRGRVRRRRHCSTPGPRDAG
jgi:hypothetical protein